MLEMDNEILERIVDALNALEMLMSISLNADGTLKNPGFFSGASTNGTDSYTATVVGITSQAALLGKLLILKTDVANAGPASLNANSYGVFPIVRFQDQPLESNALKANKYHLITWDGTNYILQSNLGVVPPSNYGVDTGPVNALAVAQSGYIDIPETLYPGYAIFVKAAQTNTAASTLALGSHAPISLKRRDGTDPRPGDITINRVFQAVYDGVDLIIPGANAAKVMPPFLDSLTLDNYVSGVLSHAHGLGAVPDVVRVVLFCDQSDAGPGYSYGAELNIESISQNDADPAFQVLVDATSVYVVSKKEGVYRVLKADGSGVALSFDDTKWKIKIYAARL